MVCSIVLQQSDLDSLLKFMLCCRYAKFKIGDPPQEIEVDLNMLVSDFYIVATTSRRGSKYDDFFSQSVGVFQWLR